MRFGNVSVISFPYQPVSICIFYHNFYAMNNNIGSKIVDDIYYYISKKSMEEGHSCICIPLFPSGYDYWTKLLTRSFGVTGNVDRAYGTTSLLVPRLTEVLLNLVITGWFNVDGFSSSLVARKIIRDYVVNIRGSRFTANAFLTSTIWGDVKGIGTPAGSFLLNFMARSNSGCAVLKFRPGCVQEVEGPFRCNC